MQEQANINYQAALGYAAQAIKAGFALNGGALIAIPTFASLLKIDPATSSQKILYALIVFTFGLLLAWFTSIVAYFSTRYAEESWSNLYHGTRLDYILAWGQSPQAPPTPQAIKKFKDDSVRESRIATRLNTVATIIGMGSVVSFVVGCFLSFYTML